MHNNLETFVKSNREAFDTLEPSATIWQTIDTGIQTPASVTASKIAWLKPFLFGASVIAGITYFAVNTNEAQSPQKVTSNVRVISTTEFIHKELEPKKEEQTVISPMIPDTNSRQKGRSKLMAIAQSNEKGETVITLENPNILDVKTEIVKPIAPIIPIEPIAPVTPITPIAPITPIVPPNSIMGSTNNEIIVHDTVFSGIKKIEINSSLTDIDIKTNVSSLTHVNYSVEEAEEKNNKRKEKTDQTNQNKISYIINNETLIITIIQSERRCVSKGNNGMKTMNLNLDIPKETSVIIKNSLGDVAVKGVEGEKCTIYNTLGNVTIENTKTKLDLITITGDLTLRENQGDLTAEVRLGDFTVDGFSGNIQMNTTTGDSKISNVTGNIDVHSSLGDQKYEQVTGDIKSSCSSGDVRISNVKGNVDLSSSLGDINFENYIGTPTIRTSSGDISGTNVELVDKITIESTLGDVHFDLVNKMDDLSFDLKTNIGTININKDGHKIEGTDKLVINKGKILVKGSTSSGDQSFK